MKNSCAYPDLLCSPLVADLPGDLGRQFIDRSTLRRHESRADILLQGQHAPGIFLVAEGNIEVSYSDADGNVSIIHIAGPGEVVGEVEAIGEQPCAATCIAMPGAHTLLFAKGALGPYLKEPVFVRNLAAILHDRLTRNNQIKSMGDYGSVDIRLRMYLWQMSAARQSVAVSQEYLSMLVGCSRETINRKLRHLRDECVLELERGRVTVLDRDRLKL